MDLNCVIIRLNLRKAFFPPVPMMKLLSLSAVGPL